MINSKSPFVKLLSIGCVLLLLVLILEVLFLNLPDFDSTPSTRVMKEETALQLNSSESLVAEDYDEISLRPLFIEGRQRIGGPGPIEGDFTVDEPTNRNSFKVRLVGVGLMDSATLVLVVDKKGKYHRLHVNDKLEGWSVESIEQSSVVFSQEGKSKTFDLEKERPLLE